jgi:hypothetical protein
MGLCQPATAILLVSVAGILYHLVTGSLGAVIWWIMVGLFGTGVFQLLCRGGLEPVAWVLMSIPVLIVCFFLAVALFAARMRIETVREVPCERKKDHGGCHKPEPKCHKSESKCHKPEPKKPRCNRSPCNGCPSCMWGGGGPGIDDAASEGVEKFAQMVTSRHNPKSLKGSEGFDQMISSDLNLSSLKGCEGFTNAGKRTCGSQACGCIGGPCPDCGRPGQPPYNDCGGSGCPYCAYAANVAESSQIQGLSCTFI